MKEWETVDLKQHFREFYRIFLPILLLVVTVLLVLWTFLKTPEWKPAQIKGEDTTRRDGLLLAEPGGVFDPAFAVLSPIEMATAPIATRFDSPMGSEHGALTYNAQPFLTNNHLGEDFNGIGGQNSDLGDPVFCIGEGRVIYAGWAGDGWGNVVIVIHRLPDGRLIESFYGHLDAIQCYVDQHLHRGQKLGTVGNANGRYLAHLHFEIRTYPTLDPGAGYAAKAQGRLAGERFLITNRGAPDDMLNPPPIIKGVEVDEASVTVNTAP
ncbi:MAG: M23 family metallopeptidase [Verrucomicrobiota bacterium]